MSRVIKCTVRRDVIVEYVKIAASVGGVADTDADRIVAKVSDPSVTRVAVGVWDYISESCQCPARLAFGVSAEWVGAFDAFAQEFDALVLTNAGISTDSVAVAELID